MTNQSNKPFTVRSSFTINFRFNEAFVQLPFIIISTLRRISEHQHSIKSANQEDFNIQININSIFMPFHSIKSMSSHCLFCISQHFVQQIKYSFRRIQQTITVFSRIYSDTINSRIIQIQHLTKQFAFLDIQFQIKVTLNDSGGFTYIHTTN